MFKFFYDLYRKHTYPDLYCFVDDCYNQGQMDGMCAWCVEEVTSKLEAEELLEEIYEYLGGENYGFN